MLNLVISSSSSMEVMVVRDPGVEAGAVSMRGWELDGWSVRWAFVPSLIRVLGPCVPAPGRPPLVGVDGSGESALGLLLQTLKSNCCWKVFGEKGGNEGSGDMGLGGNSLRNSFGSTPALWRALVMASERGRRSSAIVEMTWAAGRQNSVPGSM